MANQIREHVDYLFRTAPPTARAAELKEELIVNLTDRYQDLIQQGETEETAFGTVIAGIGDMEELLRGLREHAVFDPVNLQIQRQKSAILISIAVGLYFISIILPAALYTFFGGIWSDFGPILMLIFCAAATILLVYNSVSKPKYVKMKETIVEDFKEWSTEKSRRRSLYRSVHALIWLVSVPLYLSLGFFLGAWHPGWMIFILAPILNVILHLISIYREDG